VGNADIFRQSGAENSKRIAGEGGAVVPPHHALLYTGTPYESPQMTARPRLAAPEAASSSAILTSICPGHKPPCWAAKRPAHPCESAIQNRFTMENAKGANRPGEGPGPWPACPRPPTPGASPCASASAPPPSLNSHGVSPS
jgi:hypothetical protein